MALLVVMETTCFEVEFNGRQQAQFEASTKI
jgi:hypothetical protein